MRLLQLLEATANSTWYHGTPELQKISEFEGRTLSVDYLTDPEKWMAIQDQMQKVESGSDEYMDLIHAAGNLRQHKNVRSPVFLSNQYPIAKTYADDRRAFDYQAAVPGVIPVEVAPGNTLTINGRGQSFRGITIDSVRQGLSQAGIDEPTINREIAQFTHQLRGDGDVSGRRGYDCTRTVRALQGVWCGLQRHHGWTARDHADGGGDALIRNTR